MNIKKDNFVLLSYVLIGFSILFTTLFLGSIIWKRTYKTPASVGISKSISNKYVEGRFSASLPWYKKISDYLIFNQKEFTTVVAIFTTLLVLILTYFYFEVVSEKLKLVLNSLGLITHVKKGVDNLKEAAQNFKDAKA